MRTGAIVLVAAAAVLALTAGCTGDNGGAEPTPSPTRSAAPAVPTLTTAWTAPAEQRAVADGASRSWTTPSTLVVAGKQALRAFAPTTGTARWTLDLPEQICLTSDQANADGVLAVLLGTEKEATANSCTRAGAVDLDTGTLLWTSSIAAAMSDYGTTGVQLGPKAVAFTNTCNSAVTLSARTGRVLARFPSGATTPDECGDSFASDGRIVVDGRESNDRGGADAFIGSDAVTGRRLWSIPVKGDAAYASPNIRMRRVVSSDPVVIDAEVNGHRFLRTVDPRAARVTPFGRQASSSAAPTFTHLFGDTLVVQFGGSRVLFAFDTDTGAQQARTVLADNEFAVGVRGGTVLTRAVVTGPGVVAGVRPGQQLIRAVDPESGTRRILGRFTPALTQTLTVAGDTLVTASDTGLTGLRLPTSGLSYGDLPDRTRFARGELTTARTAELCLGITPRTRRALGFADPTLPVPAGCQWVESLANDGLLLLYTSVRTIAPAAGVSATEGARRTAEGLMQPDEVNKLPAATPVSGIGDQAGIVTSNRTQPLARIVVRRANVVVVIDLTEDLSPKTVVATLARGARLVAADLVAEIDRRRA